MTDKLRIGVLAMQGAFREHMKALSDCEPTADIVAVRTGVSFEARELPAQLRTCGESNSARILPLSHAHVLG